MAGHDETNISPVLKGANAGPEVLSYSMVPSLCQLLPTDAFVTRELRHYRRRFPNLCPICWRAAQFTASQRSASTSDAERNAIRDSYVPPIVPPTNKRSYLNLKVGGAARI